MTNSENTCEVEGIIHSWIGIEQLENNSNVTDTLAQLFGNNFDVKEVISMKNLFYKCKGLNELDLRGFNTLKCQIFDNMFGECNEMNVTIYNKYNEKLIAAAPNYIHFQTDPIVEFDFLADE